MISITETEDGITFSIKVMPRSSRCEIVGVQEDALKLKITAPPVDGSANEECIRYLSKLLHIGKSSIRIIGGEHSRKKIIRISGLTRKDFEARIPEMNG